MQDSKKEEWKRICEQAAHEQDPEKLMLLAQKIIALLDEGIRDARVKSKTDDL